MFKRLAQKHYEKIKERKALKENPVEQQKQNFFTPLKIYLHSTIRIFTPTEWVLMEGYNADLTFPTGDFTVLAIGKMPFDKQTFWRIYLEDDTGEEFILCLLESENKIVDNPMLLKQIATIVPQTDAQLNRFTSQIGFQQLETDNGLTYNRVWGDQWTEKLEFRHNEFTETAVSESGIETFINQYMLYSREIESGETEWLFVGLEEGDEFGEIAFQVGFSVPLSDVDVQ